MSEELDEVYQVEVTQYGKKEHHGIKTAILNARAEFAKEMLCRWGMVTSTNDAEDSQGRYKPNIMPPQRVVERACHLASAAFDEFERRGWAKKIRMEDTEDYKILRD